MIATSPCCSGHNSLTCGCCCFRSCGHQDVRVCLVVATTDSGAPEWALKVADQLAKDKGLNRDWVTVVAINLYNEAYPPNPGFARPYPLTAEELRAMLITKLFTPPEETPNTRPVAKPRARQIKEERQRGKMLHQQMKQRFNQAANRRPQKRPVGGGRGR